MPAGKQLQQLNKKSDKKKGGGERERDRVDAREIELIIKKAERKQQKITNPEEITNPEDLHHIIS